MLFLWCSYRLIYELIKDFGCAVQRIRLSYNGLGFHLHVIVVVWTSRCQILSLLFLLFAEIGIRMMRIARGEFAISFSFFMSHWYRPWEIQARCRENCDRERGRRRPRDIDGEVSHREGEISRELWEFWAVEGWGAAENVVPEKASLRGRDFFGLLGMLISWVGSSLAQYHFLFAISPLVFFFF